MTQKFTDNGRALLVSSITAVDTTLTVEAAKADRFPLGTTTDWLSPPLDWFKIILQDALGNREVIWAGTRTAGSGVMGTLLRGREGTTARAWSSGASVTHGIVATDVENALAGVFPSLNVSGTAVIGGKLTHNGVESRPTPVGGIIMWSGAVLAIPAGWALCDGTNGTPNLRDRFVLGAGSTYAVGATGGSKDAIVVSHTHSATFAGAALAAHGHGISDPGHAHVQNAATAYAAGGNNITSGGGLPRNTSPGTTTDAAATGVSVVAASAGTPAGTVAVNSNGASGTDANLPPYYALAFIMCLATP